MGGRGGGDQAAGLLGWLVSRGGGAELALLRPRPRPAFKCAPGARRSLGTCRRRQPAPRPAAIGLGWAGQGAGGSARPSAHPPARASSAQPQRGPPGGRVTCAALAAAGATLALVWAIELSLPPPLIGLRRRGRGWGGEWPSRTSCHLERGGREPRRSRPDSRKSRAFSCTPHFCSCLCARAKARALKDNCVGPEWTPTALCRFRLTRPPPLGPASGARGGLPRNADFLWPPTGD